MQDIKGFHFYCVPNMVGYVLNHPFCIGETHFPVQKELLLAAEEFSQIGGWGSHKGVQQPGLHLANGLATVRCRSKRLRDESGRCHVKYWGSAAVVVHWHKAKHLAQVGEEMDVEIGYPVCRMLQNLYR